MIDTQTIQIQEVAQSRITEIDFDNLVFGRSYSDHMFVADFDGKNWTDLRIVPYENMGLSPATCALHYGQAIFEGLKAYKTPDGTVQVFRPDENIKRMNFSARRMCMAELPESIYFDGLNKLLELDNAWIPEKEGTSLYIRPFMFATDEFIGLKASEKYRFIIFTCPVGAYYSAPVKLKLETHYTRAATGGVGSAKTAGNYAASLYPTKLAQEAGYDQVIWTDGQTHEYIEEVGSMNIMFYIGDTVITPETGDSVLNSITRMSVAQMLREWGIKVEERRVSVAEVMQAIQKGTLKEAFGVGTAATISHVSLIGHDEINYELPPIEKRTLAPKILQELDSLKYGKIEDTRNWMHKI